MFAGAAFTDSADFKVKTEVVDTLVQLGVINGYTDGSFKPNDTVTRAEMAKMIYVLRTGNSDASAYNDDYSTFTDIKGHWARGYVKYCQSLGIIAGQSATKFAPDQTVTAQEAAKMLLVTLGYNAEKAGLVGASWASKTNALADENGLLEDVTTSFTGPCPRQYAAQLMYNAIDTATVVWRDDAYTNQNYNGADNQTIGEKYMGLAKKAASEGILRNVKKEDNKDTFRVTVYINGADTSFTKVATNYVDLLGQKVHVLYKDGQKDKVYGIYATDENLAVTALKDDIDDADKTNGKFKVDGTEYKTNATGTQKAEDKVLVYTTPDLTTSQVGTPLKNIPAYETVTLIDNNDDDKIDFGIYTPTVFGKVTYLGSDSVTVKAKGATSFVSGNSEDFDIDDDNVVMSKDLKKDAYVTVTERTYSATDATEINEAQSVSGKVQAIKTDSSLTKEVKVDGNWYKVANYVANSDANKIDVDDEVDMYVANGFVFYSEKTKGSVSANNIVFVDKAAAKNYGTDAGDVILANLYFADGTSKKDVNVAKVNGTKIDSVTTDATIASNMVAQRLYKFSTKSNGDYELTALSTSELGGYDAFVTGNTSVSSKDGKFSNVTVKDENNNTVASTTRFEDDAVVFVKDKDDVKVRTGAGVSSWDKAAGYYTSLCGVADKSSGNYYIGIGAVVIPTKATGASDVKFGMLTSNLSKTKDDSTDYYNFTIWNGTESVEVKAEDDGQCTGFKKNVFIAYTEVGADANGVMEIEIEENYTDQQIATAGYEVKTVANAVAVASYDAKNKSVSFMNIAGAKEYDLSDDVVIIGVNTEDKKGVAGVELDVADETSTSGVYFKNAVFFMDGDEVIAIFVDSKGAMYNNGKLVTP